jgi:hypothetical protein
MGGIPIYYFVRAENTEGNWTTMPRYGPEAHYSTQFVNTWPQEPEELAAARVGNDMRFIWRATREDLNGVGVDSVSYHVYGSNSENPFSGTLLASTTDTSVTVIDETLNASAKRFYGVKSMIPN